jgi:two-component sensor histidine kinase
MDRWTELALVSHEVGGALTPARNALHLLREDPPRGMDSRQQRLLDMITRSLERTDRVLGNLSSIALPENYQEKLETCSPHTWLQEWIRPYQDEAVSRNLRLDLDVLEELSSFPTDLFLLEQVLGNLVSNALKFTPAGGRVRVSAQPNRGAVLPGKMLLLAGGFGARPRFLQIVVEDTGMGISPETRRHLFVPFYRGEEAAQHAGTGLGLTVSRRLVHLLHGDLRAEDCATGARFVLTLPADAATRALCGSTDSLYAALRREISEKPCTLLVARLKSEEHDAIVGTAIETLGQQTHGHSWRISPTTWVLLSPASARHLYRSLADHIAPAADAVRKELHVHVRRARRGENVDELALQTVVRCRQPFPAAVFRRTAQRKPTQVRTEVA